VAAAVVRTGGTNASSAFIAIEALAQAALSVTDALVRALHVEVTLVGIGVGKLLGSAPRVHFGASNYRRERAGNHAVGVQVSLRGVDVGNAKVASTLRAVVALVVLVALALVLCSQVPCPEQAFGHSALA